MQKTNKNNTISIPLFVVILAIMVVLTLFFSIKTICFGNNDSEEIEQVEEQVEEPQEEVQPCRRTKTRRSTSKYRNTWTSRRATNRK